jgi:hypothetical protein
MFDEGKFNIYDDFLTKDELSRIEKYFERPIWQFGHSSTDSDNLPQQWFVASLNHLPVFTRILKEKIETLVGSKYSLLRVYANGQTILNGGSWHQDADKSEHFTALLYISDINKHNVEQIHGHTEFRTKDGLSISVEPLKNRLVVFDSSIFHRGNAPIVPGFLRISIAWKLKKNM